MEYFIANDQCLKFSTNNNNFNLILQKVIILRYIFQTFSSKVKTKTLNFWKYKVKMTSSPRMHSIQKLKITIIEY